MAKKDDVPENIIAPKPPEPPPENTRPIQVHADVDLDKLADKVAEKLGGTFKSITDPIAEMLGIIKPAKPPEPPPAPPENKKPKTGPIIPWFK